MSKYTLTTQWACAQQPPFAISFISVLATLCIFKYFIWYFVAFFVVFVRKIKIWANVSHYFLSFVLVFLLSFIIRAQFRHKLFVAFSFSHFLARSLSLSPSLCVPFQIAVIRINWTLLYISRYHSCLYPITCVLWYNKYAHKTQIGRQDYWNFSRERKVRVGAKLVVLVDCSQSKYVNVYANKSMD